MPVPDFQSIMLPMLQLASDGNTYNMQQARDSLANEFNLSEEELSERLPSGRQTTFSNRVAWAKVYLVRAGLLESPERGRFKISDRGRDVLKQAPSCINIKFLSQYPEFQDFRQPGGKERAGKKVEPQPPEETPEEMLEQAYQQLRNEVAEELLKLIKNNSPEFFEKLVVHLLVQMGYGGSVREAGKATRKTSDEGIDGIIKEDRLGLDAIYLQAKRWEAPIGRPEIQKFVGALYGQKAKKGVFITTSRFSSEAMGYASQIDPKVVLIDGNDLVELMIDYGVGVGTSSVYEIKKVDMDFFIEE